MAKLTPAQMKKAVEEFKKKFTTGFYHGSPSPDIKEFDPTKSKKDPMYTTPKATFVTRDPEFAESFLSMNNSGKVKSGSTMYPVSVNLGQHWNPNTPEGQAVIAEFIEQYPKRVNLEKGLKRGDWTAIENSDFLTHLKNTGHDTFHVVEGGIPNVGVLKPQNIRGKFAEYNPEEAANPDFMKAEGGKVGALTKLAKGLHGQNSLVSYSGMNEELINAMNQLKVQREQLIKSGGDPSDINNELLKLGQQFKYAPQKPLILPPEQVDINYRGYAAGGAIKAAKKVLEHAKSVPFVHYSNAPSISTLDPNMYGKGIKGAEAARLKDAPDIKPRSYFYTKAGGRQPEQGLGSHKYEGVAENIYPLHDDPMGFSAIARERAIDPYMMQFGREVVDEATHLNELERLIKKAGYKGYANDDVGLLFDPTPVMKAE